VVVVDDDDDFVFVCCAIGFVISALVFEVIDGRGA